MIFMIMLALLNGLFISLSRILNGQLAASHGAFKASYVNHLVGFICLSVIMLLLSEPVQTPAQLEPVTYFGGFIGAFYVVVNSLVMVHLGASNTILLVIGGQMICGVLLDSSNSSVGQLTGKIIGVAMILLGMYLKEMALKRATSGN